MVAAPSPTQVTFRVALSMTLTLGDTFVIGCRRGWSRDRCRWSLGGGVHRHALTGTHVCGQIGAICGPAVGALSPDGEVVSTVPRASHRADRDGRRTFAHTGHVQGGAVR